MNKKIAFFLLVAQSALIIFNILIYGLLITFFPRLGLHATSLLVTILLLSISFLTFSVLTFKHENVVLRIGGILSSIWLVTSFYFVICSLVVLIAYLFHPVGLENYGYAAVIVTLLAAIYGLINARVTQVTKIKVTLPNLPEFWKGKTAMVAADLHLGQVLKHGFARKIIKIINKENPDIVFIPGDFYDGVHTGFQSLANEFKNTKAPLGIYFCSGNHEMFAGYDQCEKALRGAGIKILENQMVELNGLQIAGVAYKHDTMPDLPQTLNSLNLNRNKPALLLKHVPLQLKEIAEAGINFVICGHTHHGQVWPFRYITKRYFKGFDYGFKMFKNLQVYTSSGAGTWGPPMRVFTKSELVKITFN
jgi:uncharacterized protein